MAVPAKGPAASEAIARRMTACRCWPACDVPRGAAAVGWAPASCVGNETPLLEMALGRCDRRTGKGAACVKHGLGIDAKD